MPLAQKKRVILVKSEPSYAVDAVPNASDAVLCSNLNINPLEGSSVSRDFIRPYFGSGGDIRVENYVKLDFEIEAAGSGTAGTPPKYGDLLKSCNFSETITAAAITGTGQAGGSTTTIVLEAGASAIDGFYDGMSIDITGGTGNGQKGEIIGYDGATKTATIAVAWAVPTDATSVYSIGANVIYTPNSNFGLAANTSSSIYFNVDGVRHVLLGARGTCTLDLSSKAIPKFKFDFTGLLGVVSDSALPAADFDGWQIPETVSTENTTDVNLLGFTSSVLQTLNFDMANDVIFRQLVGSESVLITDRKPAGNVSIEATTVAVKDWWADAKDSLYGVFSVKHGQTAGNIVGVTAPNVQIQSPKYSDSDGVTMIDMTLSFVPKSSQGNDEIRICVK